MHCSDSKWLGTTEKDFPEGKVWRKDQPSLRAQASPPVPRGSVAVADGTTDQLHHFADAIAAPRAQVELKLNCTAQRMLGRCRLRLKTTTAQGAWVVRPLCAHYSSHCFA